jgi:uncharacterized membrane protein
LKHLSESSKARRNADGRSWWGFGSCLLVAIWFIVTGWWCIQDSRARIVIDVEGVGSDTYARMVVETEDGWQEATPLWFPAYTLRGGSGQIEYRIKPGWYRGFRFALDRGQVTGGGFFPEKSESAVPPVKEWQYDSNGIVTTEPLKDDRSRAVPTWQWIADEPIYIARQSFSEWIPEVSLRSGSLLLFILIVSSAIFILVRLCEYWGDWFEDKWNRFSEWSSGRVSWFYLIVSALLGWVLWNSPEWFNRYLGQEMFLQIEMSSSVESSAQVFFRDKGGYQEQKSALEHVVGDNLKQTLFFPLGRERLRGMRLDPLMTAGEVSIYSVRLVTIDGDLIQEIPLDQIQPGRDAVQIKEYVFDPEAGCWRITTEEGALDPSFTLLNQSKKPIHYFSWADVIGLLLLWITLGIFLILSLARGLFASTWEQWAVMNYLDHPDIKRLLAAIAGTVILILPVSYFLKAFQGEAAYLEMSATASADMTGSWSFRSGRDSFLHHDYRFSLKAGERRSFHIALPRNKVHHYKLEFLGGEQDGTVQVDSLVFLVPSLDSATNLLEDHEGYHWVKRPAITEEGFWEFPVRAGERIRFHLEDDTFVLQMQPLWLQLIVLMMLVVGCFVVLWVRGSNQETQPTAIPPRGHPASWFLGLMLVFGMLFVWLTPPFQSPDEPRWLDRAWHISEGNMFPVVNEELNLAGGYVPTSFRTVYKVVSYDIPFNSHRRTNLERWNEANQIPLQEEDVFFARMGDNTHSLLPYAPMAFGFQIGKWLGLTPLEMTYAARILNLLVAALLVALAIRLFPQVPWTILVLFLSPIIVFLFGSANHDPMTNALTLLFVAVVFCMREGKRRIGWWHCLLLVVLIFAVIASKFVYVTLAGLLLVLPVELFSSARDRWVKIGVTWAVMILVTLVWLSMLIWYPKFDYDRPEVDQGLNKALLVQRPETVLEWIANTWEHDKELWQDQFVGVLGWLDTTLPTVIHMIWWMALAAALVADAGGRSWRPGIFTRGWVAALVIFILGVVTMLFFLIYTQPGLERIQGVQGRYLYPLLPLVVAAVSFRCHGIQSWTPWLRRFVILAVSLVLSMTLLLLRFRYWDL